MWLDPAKGLFVYFIQKEWMSFAFEKTPSISLGCKVVPVHYLDCEYDNICLVSLLLNLAVYVKTKNVIQGYQIFTDWYNYLLEYFHTINWITGASLTNCNKGPEIAVSS